MDGAFCELAAEACLIDTGAKKGGDGEEVIEDGFLDREWGVLEAEELAGEEDVVDIFEEPEDSEVMVAADIDAEEEVVAGVGGLG